MLKHYIYLVALLLLVVSFSCGLGKQYAEVRKQETAGPYEAFLVRHGKSKYAPEARSRLDAIYQLTAYKAARDAESVALYEQFLKKYPQSMLAGRAREELAVLEEKVAWQKAVNANTVASYDIYLRRYPAGLHAMEARNLAVAQKVTDDWNTAKTTDTEQVLRAFVDKYPTDRRVAEAQLRITRAREREAWKATDFQDQFSLARFVAEFPSAPEAANANRQINILRESEAWKTATTAGTPGAFRIYLADWPAGIHRAQAQAEIRENEVHGPAWREAKSLGTPDGYARFIEEHGDSRRIGEARAEKASLERQRVAEEAERRIAEAKREEEARERRLAAEAAAAEQKRQAEADSWRRAVNTNTISGYKRYARDYPFSAHADEVDKKIIDLEVEAIFRGEHGKLPAMQRSSYGAYSASTSITVQNDTEYTLTVRYSGPTSKKIEITRGDTRSFSLASGSYKITASVNARNVQNYAGSENLAGGEYSSKFYIETTTRWERY